MAQSHRPDARGTPPAPGVVELRVHGVGGTPPEDILDVPVTCLVAGDESAGFFRPWEPAGGVGPPREAYSWGGLTSASSLRALWVLLTPFALANLAGWMLRHGGEPTDTEPRKRDALETLAAAAVRVFGLVITVALTAYLALGAIDLVGYQCGARPACIGGRWWLSPWSNRLVAAAPGRAVAVGAVVAVAAVLAIAWLARRSQIVIHDRRPASFTAADDPVFTGNLHHRRLWDSPHIAHRLGLTHTAAALTVVGLTMATSAEQTGGFSEWMVPVGWVVLALCLLAALRLEGVASTLHLALVAVASVYLVALILWSLGVPGPDPAAGPLPGAQTVLTVLLPVYALGGLLIGVFAYLLWRGNPHGRLRVALVGPGLLLLSAGLVNAFGSGLLIRLADLLGSPLAASDDPAGPASPAPIVYPDWVGDIAVVTVFALALTAVAATVAWIRAGRGPSCETLARRYADRGGLDCDNEEDLLWARRVGRAQAVATITDQVAMVLSLVTVGVLAGMGLAVLASDDPSGLRLGEWTAPLAAPASVILGAVPVVAVIGISRLYRSRAVRRVVGTLWDVATFWPRWFHPWSPPSYGERAVPQLGRRLEVLSEGGTVLSAHSQGSVLAVATLALAEREVSARTALLTHGSPLTRLYARYFPEHFAAELFGEVAETVPAWINLWRSTDFIGGRIRARRVDDREVFDPPSSRAPSPDEPRPKPLRHSSYDRTDEYRVALAELLQAVHTDSR